MRSRGVAAQSVGMGVQGANLLSLTLIVPELYEGCYRQTGRF